MTGLITDIQRFSIHDGPGIRTTVFLKGCNMVCAWCHNPEALAIKRQLQFYPDKCIGCGACFSACGYGVHEIKEGMRQLHRAHCTACGACAEVCCAESLQMAGKEVTIEAVMEEVLADRDFYAHSGGGITLSGGEPACQIAFAKELLNCSKQEGLHTAIETNLSLGWSEYEGLLPFTDLVLFDIKLMDPELHQTWTGISNDIVMSNARTLSETGKPMVVRTPVIPGVNDDPETISAIAEFIKDFKSLQYYELMPYHPLGAGKYTSLGMEYAMRVERAPSEEQMQALAAAARNIGISVKP